VAEVWIVTREGGRGGGQRRIQDRREDRVVSGRRYASGWQGAIGREGEGRFATIVGHQHDGKGAAVVRIRRAEFQRDRTQGRGG
jgi:hypothetical protein